LIVTPTLPASIRTPAYVLDVSALKHNMAVVARLKKEAGCKVLLATKAWAMPVAFPLMRDTLDGTTASGEYEARLGREEFGKEVHVYAPAYAPGEVERLTKLADHIYFNSPEQIARWLPVAREARRHVGIRVNPGYSHVTVGGGLYDPCAPYSRFGTLRSDLDALPWGDIDTLHAHALCESFHDGSVGLISHIGRAFAPYLHKVSAVNFGGGHFINRPGYDVEVLIAALRAFRAEFGLEVYLEPGGGLVANAGYLVATVIGLHRNEKDIAILDTSASAHMPDALEAGYTPPLIGSGKPGELPHGYILGGKTCMTGDVIGEYSFSKPLEVGDRLVFSDQMHYSFVKNTTFNGTPLPDLGILDEDGSYRVVSAFGYEDFRRRLG
jgi:carboxynorspermidine decarboxylase